MDSTLGERRYFIKNNDGSITFTQYGYEKLAPLYKEAGINIDEITTLEQQREAIDFASSYLLSE